MKLNRFFSLSLKVTLGAIIVCCAASCRDLSRKQALADERQNWETSLKDSLVAYEKQLNEAKKNIPALRQSVDSLLALFTPVNNPREVEGYYIYSPARGSYPLASTSITARLSKSEAPEVIAALKGGRFTTIRLLSGGESVESQKVPFDQALNYRTATLNTVAFTGEEVPTLLEFVYKHRADKIRMEFLNPETVKNVILSEKEKETMAATWLLIDARRKLHHTESSIPVISEKIRRLKERDNS